MKTLIKTTTLVVFTSFLAVACGESPKTEVHGHDHDHGEMSDAAYYCPMKCEGDKTYAESGECPVCHMDLVEKK